MHDEIVHEDGVPHKLRDIQEAEEGQRKAMLRKVMQQGKLREEIQKIDELREDLTRVETLMYRRRCDGNVQSEEVQGFSKEDICVQPALLLLGERFYALLLQTPVAPQATHDSKAVSRMANS